VQLLLERREPRLGTLEPSQRLVDRRKTCLRDTSRLRVELTDRLLVRLLEGAPFVLQAALELVDARGRLVQEAPFDVIPFA
jgi:hypothetical protein